MNSHASCPARRIYRTHEIRLAEQATAAPPDTPSLMERAGLAAAGLAQRLLGNGTSVLVLAGPGNNGGDALVAARHLKRMWFKVTVVFTGDPEKLPPDAAKALQAWLEAGGELLAEIPAGGKWDLVVDGLFGIGLARELDDRSLELVNRVNRMNLPVLALDIPSGLDSDSGRPLGAAVRAAHTLTFIGLKPGLLTADGPDYCGKIHLDLLGIPRELLPEARGQLLARDELAAFLKPRPLNCHKGMLGSVGILGGAPGMAGAALLAGRAALKLGAGRVYLGLLAEPALAADLQQPELMLRPPEQLFGAELSCLVAGPGLGQSEEALHWLERALYVKPSLVLDADALNLIAAHDSLRELLSKRKGSAVLTPHPAEAARLLGTTAADIQRDRVSAALALTARFGSPVVLKGTGSVCALPDGGWFINPTGNPGLSSAGTGDVLAGIVGALAAQGVPPEQALLLAVHLHGAAADELVAEDTGPIGLTASEVTDKARELLNRWVYPEKPATNDTNEHE
jgi:hydroxyethylthiazole kinase-like uncharacterized protein yjeF